eukprot:CAMPEP_0197629008 /NCGR_PEP_ID=MMETSP1338-20131121/7054_1 /TAXON_ID=43686 ORGANISM="Pelagodinium beii, Strain RCC1491" /NCGR_SAMPLE_ID=MMETSP1338 /ASSEMBLY_ACC=CAM_ASM_000754 /LENGTH=421 /DNA_ID=CAMNT_0043200015 /DNA_START=101 /DNA_END=1366 /DNA_ORIENTATION=-
MVMSTADFRPPGSDRSERSGVLYNASAARKRAEQDSMLLANRLRLLRAEEAKTRKKIADTEQKTQEVMDAKRRNEERRLAREAFEAQKEVAEQEFRARQLQENNESKGKIQEKQRKILDQNKASGDALRQQREVFRSIAEAEREEAAAEAQARAEHVRALEKNAGRSRARSEGAKQEQAQEVIRERMLREEDERRAKLLEIQRMEKEEAELMSRLQRSQERHRAAYLRLEDALRSSGQSGSTGLSPSGSAAGMLSVSSIPLEAGQNLGTPKSYASSAARPSDILGTGESFMLGGGGGGSSGSIPGARPPRPRGLPGPTVSSGRPGSASRYATPKMQASAGSVAGAANSGDAVDKLRQKHSASAMSSCSTASGAESGRGASGSGHSTPSSAAHQIRYTTVDGLQLEIPAEEDLDLAALLNGR